MNEREIERWVRGRVYKNHGGLYFEPEDEITILGNMRDHAALEQLVVLSNLESLNSVLIHQGLPAPERLRQLNDIAIVQVRSLVASPAVKRLTTREKP